MSKRYTITAALPYTNGPIHIGHLAGVYVPADIYARYQRLQGRDVAFICGSDEHGVPITIKAKKEGVSPQDIVDKYHAIIKQSFKDFGISFDNYSRTSAKIHHETASEFFKTLYDKDEFVEEVTEQFYDVDANQFLADRFIVGTCPKCGHEESYGDQCEACGTSHNATDLINPKSAITGATPTLKKTKHWFLPLDKHESFLKQWILTDHKKDWKPNVYGQCKSWIDDGLRPRAVTRDLNWGIPVPIEGAEGKVLYVWFDAPIGYISATKEWAEREGKDWKTYWKQKDSKLLHFIGKDNIVFHCIIFPAMLKAEGSYILPENVPANEFLNLEGEKISTSKNWAVWLHEYLKEFPDQQDVLRYVLTSNAPETKDNDFTWDEFQARNNNELVAIYGNFINRVVVLTHKYYEGKVPTPGNLTEQDNIVLEEMALLPEKIGNAIEHYRFREASQLLIQLARLGNKYLADAEPWKLIKTDPERVKTIMHTALQIAAGLSILSEPILPFTAKKLSKMLLIDPKNQAWDQVAKVSTLIDPGHQIETASLLFQKIENDQMEQQRMKLKASVAENKIDSLKIAPIKPTTSIDDFKSLDLKVAKIIAAEKVRKTKKLMQLTVDLGQEQRTVVSGIAEDFSPEDLIGKQVTLLTNLHPRTLKGIESNGMILLGENATGSFVFVNPENKETKTGLSIH